MKAFVLIFFVAISSVFAQKGAPPSEFGIDLHAGIGGGTEGMTFVYGTNVSYGKQLVQLRGLYFTGDIFDIGYTDKIYEYALLYGFKTSSTTSLSAGIGYNSGTIYETADDYFEERQISAYGLALQGSYVKSLFSFVGLGFSAHANLNKQNSFYALTASLHFGKLQ